MLCREQGSSLWRDGSRCFCWVRLVTLLPSQAFCPAQKLFSKLLSLPAWGCFPLFPLAGCCSPPAATAREHHSHRHVPLLPPPISRGSLHPASPGCWEEQGLQEHGASFPQCLRGRGQAALAAAAAPRRAAPLLAWLCQRKRGAAKRGRSRRYLVSTARVFKAPLPRCLR